MAIYLRFVEEGLGVTSIITHRFALADWRFAFKTLMDRKSSGAVKVLLRGDAPTM